MFGLGRKWFAGRRLYFALPHLPDLLDSAKDLFIAAKDGKMRNRRPMAVGATLEMSASSMPLPGRWPRVDYFARNIPLPRLGVITT